MPTFQLIKLLLLYCLAMGFGGAIGFILGASFRPSSELTIHIFLFTGALLTLAVTDKLVADGRLDGGRLASVSQWRGWRPHQAGLLFLVATFGIFVWAPVAMYVGGFLLIIPFIVYEIATRLLS